jgi:hypothetical protein
MHPAGKAAETVRSLEDAFVDSYIGWREACEDVRNAYRRWHESCPGQRDPSFEGFCAALNWEEQMARAHSIRLAELRARKVAA